MITNWQSLAERFATQQLTKQEWTHEAHLLVAAWFIHNYPPIEAGVRIRVGIRELNLALGGKNTPTSGFNEEITEYWIRRIRAHLEEHGASEHSLRLLLQMKRP
jgi:hypothetical protein